MKTATSCSRSRTATTGASQHGFAVTAKVTTIFSLKVSNAIRYVHQPVVGFKSTDVITAVALVAKF